MTSSQPRRRKEPRIGMLRQEDPPAVQSPRARYAERVARVVPDLRRHHDVWFRVAEFHAQATAGNMVRELKAKHPQVEWTSRTMPTGGGSMLWARWPTGQKQGTGRNPPDD